MEYIESNFNPFRSLAVRARFLPRKSQSFDRTTRAYNKDIYDLKIANLQLSMGFKFICSLIYRVESHFLVHYHFFHRSMGFHGNKA